MIKNIFLLTSFVLNSSILSTNFSNANTPNEVQNQMTSQPATLEELRASDPLEIASLDKYDSRKYDIVTYPKLQVENICWSFATMGASETSIVREGLFSSDTRNLYLNERNHAFNTFNNDSSLDPLNLTIGDNYNSDTIDKGYHLYGSGQRMLTWTTPSIENFGDSSLGYRKPDFLLEDIIHVDQTSRDDIKRAIARYGAVTVVYHITDYHRDYYYYNGNVNVFDGDDHAVTIVGWDDTIDKNKYKGKPSALDGGWIVKNSWGGAHAEGDGYFIMSYDTPIKDIYAYDFASKDKYDFNYHYDSFTTRDDYLMDNNLTAAIFPVKKSSSTKEEYLKAINVSVLDTLTTKGVGEGEIIAKIYKNVKANESDIYSLNNNPINPDGLVATLSRKITHEGSYTLELPTEIELEKGTFFSVVVEVKSSNNKYKVALSTEGTSSINDLTFYEENGKWINCGSPTLRYVARIKAFTKTKDRSEPIENDLRYTNIALEGDVRPRYNAIPEKIPLTINDDGAILQEGVHYTLEPVEVSVLPGLTETTSDNDVVATGTIKAIGKGVRKGENSVSFPVLVGKHDLSQFGEVLPNGKLKMTVDGSHLTYRDIVLPKNWSFAFPDYELSVGDNEGNYLNYKGEDEVCFRRTSFDVIVTKTSEVIEKIDINNANVTLDNVQFTFNFKEHTPQVNVTYDKNLLILNKDYRVQYKNNINAGEATVEVIGIGKYKGTKRISYSIKKANISDTTINYDKEFNYDGTNIKPSVEVKIGSQVLQENKDYTLIFSNNLDAGEAEIKIQGINNFEGVINKNFTINKAKNQITSFKLINNEPVATALYGEPNYKYFSDEKCLEEISKPTKPGTYYVKAFVKESKNYEGVTSDALSFTIDSEVAPKPPVEEKININKAKISLKTYYFEYNGQEIVPEIVVTYNGNNLKYEEDYALNYMDNINAGIGKIKIKGINKFDGETSINFTINKAKNEIKDFKIVNENPVANSLFGEVDYKYYKDENCLEEISKPTKPGTYYVKAYVIETSNFEGAYSEPIEFEIKSEISPEPPVDPELPEDNGNNIGMIVAISVGTISGTAALGVALFFFIKRKMK